MKSAIASSPVVLVCPRTLVFSSAQHRIRLTCIFIVKIIAPWRETPRGGELAGEACLLLPPAPHWQRHRKRRPPPDPLALRPHASSVQLHEVVHDREAEA